MYTVYKHTSPNGKVYIGITSQNPIKRWQNGHGYRNQPIFYNAILKYGWDNFKHEILYSDLTKEEAEIKEIELIGTYQSNCHDHGYNLDNGGNSIGKMSEETKQKISASEKGKIVSIKSREKMRKAAKHKCKPLLCVETGMVFDSLRMASQITKIPSGNITHAAHGRRRKAGGYHWRFIERKDDLI